MEMIEVAYVPIWRRYFDLFERAGLSDEDLGALVRAMMDYQFHATEPEHLSESLKIFWIFIRNDLDHARAQYETAVKNGRKGGRRKKKEVPTETQQNPEEGITITESITESVTESESNSITKSESKSISKKETNKKQKQGQVSASAKTEAKDVSVSVSKSAYGEFGWVQLSLPQYRNLEALMGPVELAACIQYIDESAQCTGNKNNWLDWERVLRRCYQNQWHK
jgi:hypothetical protein